MGANCSFLNLMVSSFVDYDIILYTKVRAYIRYVLNYRAVINTCLETLKGCIGRVTIFYLITNTSLRETMITYSLDINSV